MKRLLLVGLAACAFALAPTLPASQIQTVMSFRFEAIVVAGVTITAGAGATIAAIVKSRTLVKGPPQLAASFIALDRPRPSFSDDIGRARSPSAASDRTLKF